MPESTTHSYMLRLWRAHRQAPWRVTLIAVAQPDERCHFDTLEDCFAYVSAQAAAPNGSDVHPDGNTTIVAQMEAAEK
jgi:hypothetical protein